MKVEEHHAVIEADEVDHDGIVAIGANLQDHMGPKVKRRMLRPQDEILNLERRAMEAKQKTVSKMKRWSTMRSL